MLASKVFMPEDPSLVLRIGKRLTQLKNAGPSLATSVRREAPVKSHIVND